MREGFCLVPLLTNSQCPEQCLPHSGHPGWGWSGRTVLRDTSSLKTLYILTGLLFEGQGWFITRRQSAQSWPAAWWIVQDGAFRLPQLLGVIQLVEFALLQLWASWTESEGQGRVDSCEVRFCSPRTSAGRSTEAVVTAWCRIAGLAQLDRAQAWGLCSRILLNEFSGLLNSELLKTEIFLIWGFQRNSQTIHIHHFEGETWS